MSKQRLRIVGAVVAVLALGACANKPSTQTVSTPTAKSSVTGDLKVFAASSLTESFTALGGMLKSSNSGLTVTFNFGASSTLVAQLREGGQADVFASADRANMQKLVDASVVDTPVVFARNRLAIVVGKGNPKNVTGLADLAKPGMVVVLCGTQVPCGKFADKALANAKVTVTGASREDNVKAVLTKVQLGEADAGIVYVTDVKAGGDKIQGVDIPAAQNVTATYPIASLKGARNASAARAFIELVTSGAGAQTLAGYGFLPAA
jgi:molybdate transport system substrate-binding protein